MRITSPLYDAYLKCPTKCFLRARGEIATENEYLEWARTEKALFVSEGSQRLMQETEGGECVCGDYAAGSAKSPKWRLAINFPASVENLESTIHAVEHVPSQGRGKSARFLPIRFIYTDKLSRDDRLLLAFDVLVLSKMLGREVSLGKIIHGHSRAMLNVKTSAVAVQVRKHIADIAELLSNPSPPDLILIRHCTECEFQARCRQKAMDKEDLSLLSGMTAKERKKLHDKGIFTVTQLSYTFRPRRRPKRLRDKREKYSHSLRALAIRQKKIHIVGSPEVRIEGTPVYLDVEGLPDRDFYYLIGVRLENHNPVDQYSLWADGIEDERRIWSEFLDILARIKDPVLIHYGSYEAVFLKRMANRYGLPTTAPTVSKAVATSVNLLSVIFAQVYFPTFSNNLKDIGHFLSVKWNGPVSSGFQSLAYRLEWERSRRPDLKAALVTYNREDCAAIEAVTSQLSEIISEAKSRTDVEFSDKPKKVASDKGAEIHAAFESVLRSAHFSYARSRIKLSAVKSAQALPPEKKEVKRIPRRRSFSTIKGRIVRVPRRRICPVHPGHKLSASSKTSQHSLLDLVFSKTGCRKTIVRYTGLRAGAIFAR